MITKEKLNELANNVAINIRENEEQEYLERVSEIIDLVNDLKDVEIDLPMFKTNFVAEQELREDVAQVNDMELMKQNHVEEDGFVKIKTEGL